MAHFLLIEVPGGNDFDILEAAVSLGHDITFFTTDILLYKKNGTFDKYLILVKRIIEIKPFDYDEVEKKALEIHHQNPFDAILCLIDIRIIETAKLAERLGLCFLNVESAQNLRDKFTVRTILERQKIKQPEFRLALNNEQLRDAVETLGFPVIVKPSDGYGSQNIMKFLTPNDLNPLIDPLDNYLPCKTDYGFNVQANDRLLVERFVEGQLIGCDTFTQNGQHIMLGINEKTMFPEPSAAIKGSCFPVTRYDVKEIQNYVFSVLDALNFDYGAAHVELIVSSQDIQLVEINPRLVGAKIPRLLNVAFQLSIHQYLIDLHLRKTLTPLFSVTNRFAVSRWIVSYVPGILKSITLPDMNPNIAYVEILKKEGDFVSYPYQNADRIGYVMTFGDSQRQAEEFADLYISQVKLNVIPAEVMYQ